MSWLQILLLLLAAYALIASYIKEKGLFADHIMFFGPIMAIKTEKVGFFDWFIRFKRILQGYGTLGAVMVVFIAGFFTLLLLLALPGFLTNTPSAEGIHGIQNVLALPGVNDAIPFTVAVWLGLVATIVIHEFGHAILARVEGMRVKSMGLLIAVIPLGAFVEPDEEDVEQAKGMPKIRMFGAGIANNLVAAVACFVVMFLLLGTAVPSGAPLIDGVYVDYPAADAGVPGLSVVTAVNGVPVATQEEVSAIMDRTSPGDEVALTVEKDGVPETYTMTLAEWPEALASDRDSGFLGVYYYNGAAVQARLDAIAGMGPLAPLVMLMAPFDAFIPNAETGAVDTLGLSVLLVDTPKTIGWDVPFPGFWAIIQILFWTAWFNLAVGTFNALPFVPLDGGYIMKEGIERIFERRGWSQYAPRVVASISMFMILIIVLFMTLPTIKGIVVPFITGTLLPALF
ncbi:PDZ domain-containing protein [Methanoculleus sp. FWC-SCC1]|uniref:PDZ domain-containing protein n=1 Tax=Methanoculleus frigidifontis TaxID=2584085 RepID=A0ABT8MB02_9EURY|nr:site-2 protease family protein [Methanoculleus sp. FWC-SCC1]MDN7025129.1 PDZ domain-containing protein [Methanoculleus sp. FWC-SCC1]